MQGPSVAEKLFWVMLTGAAAGGLGYGFNCLLDLVQHWALFNAGVGNLIG